MIAEPCYTGEVASKLVFEEWNKNQTCERRISGRCKDGRDALSEGVHSEIFNDDSDDIIEEVRVDDAYDAGGSVDLVGDHPVKPNDKVGGRHIELLEDNNTDNADDPDLEDGFETSSEGGACVTDSFDSFDHNIDMRKLLEKFIT